MFAGHFATALVAKQRAPGAPLAYYLVASQLPDLLWNVFHYAGIEPTVPDHPMLASVDNLQAVMTWSHDVLPALGWLALTVLVGRAITGGWRAGLVGGVVVAAHVLTDLVAGYPHNLMGPDSPSMATGMYRWAPYLAVSLEAVFTAGMLAWVAWGDRQAGVARSRATKLVWAAVFGGGLAFMFLSADLSMAELLGVDPLPGLEGLAMPVMTSSYLGMLLALVWAGKQAATPRVAPAG